MLWSFVAQFIPILYLILTGVFNATAWIFIVLGIIFISSYIYLLYIRTETRSAAPATASRR